MAKHRKDLAIFPDIPQAHAFGPFTAHFITYRHFRNTRKRDIDGEVWYVGTIVKEPRRL